MYQGISALALDAKGRMLVPTKYRDALAVQCEGQLTLTRHPHGCLLLLPRPVWTEMRKDIVAWPMAARSWQRIFMGNATDVEFDGSGRILISPELRAAAGLSKDVVLLGMGATVAASLANASMTHATYFGRKKAPAVRHGAWVGVQELSELFEV